MQDNDVARFRPRGVLGFEKIYVERGHLVVHDGVGRNRSTRRLNRAASKFDRLVVIGNSGVITLEAMRWIKDVGASFVQIDTDSNVIAMSVSERYSSSRHLRRAQVLAAETEVGRRLLVELLKAKPIEQARLAEELLEFTPTRKGRDRRTDDPAGAILAQIPGLERATTTNELRVAESIAGRSPLHIPFCQLLLGIGQRASQRLDMAALSLADGLLHGPRHRGLDLLRLRMRVGDD